MIKLENNKVLENAINELLEKLNGRLKDRLSYGEKVYKFLKVIEDNAIDKTEVFNTFTNTVKYIEREEE